MAINIDAAGEWADETATRWLSTNPMEKLNPSSRPEEIRRGVVDTIAETSAVMAEETRNTGCYAHATAEGCKTWLETCCNQAAGPRRETSEARSAPRLGNRPEPAAKALPFLRWAGISREQVQSPEIVWTRGRDHGVLAFDVVDVDGVQSIVEHGWPADENELVEKMTSAIATAACRAAEVRSRRAASMETVKQTLLEDARRHAATPGAEPPDWWKQTPV